MRDNSNPNPLSQVYFNYRQYQEFYEDYRSNILQDDDPYKQLLFAKSAFVKQQYRQCMKTLKKIDKNINTKILYEKQALLFKVSYLLNPQDINQLKQIVKDYQNSKNRCPGKKLTEFHHNNIKQMLSVVMQGRQKYVKANQINKQQLADRLKIQQKRIKYQGMPSFLVSTKWNKMFSDFVLKNKPYPGPITNFQIINHIFQLQPHNQPGKQYMDIILFPVNEEVAYYVLGSRHWHIIQQIFSGLPIKRYFIYNQKNRQLNGGDNLVKTVVESQTQKFVMQWLSGSFWQKSVLPVLSKKYGVGQLKQQTKNKDFVIIQPGKIQQPFNNLKYVRVQTQLIKAIGEKEQQRKKRIVSTFDLQKYNPENCKHDHAVGLINLGNTCYMNSGLQFLASLRNFSNYFLTNRYLSKINLSATNKDGSFGLVTCAYADLVKRLLFSSKETRYVNPTLFKQFFSNRYTLFQGNDQQDAQQFLMFMLNCLHQDLNEKSSTNLIPRQSLGHRNFQNVRDTVINHYNKHNKSIISDLFHGFHYQQIMCDVCQFQTFRFEHTLMLHIQVPPDAPRITAFVVQQNNLTQAKRVDIYIRKIQRVSQAMDVVRKYFSIKAENDIIPFIYSDDRKQWSDVTPDMKLTSIAKSLANNSYLFLHQVRIPQADQQMAMITYQINSKGYTQCDGFPRFLIMKKIFRQQQQQYKDEVLNVIYSTVPKSKFQRDRKQYIKSVKPKKLKGNKAYEVQYVVETIYHLRNYDNTNINKVLGQNQFQQAVNLMGCLQKMRKSEMIQQNQKWNCQKCRQIRKAHKTDKIYSTGKYLIFHLKRFTQNVKITTKIEYPINNFDMTPFIEEDKNKKKSIYNLQALILHRGSLNYGHYTCICRNIQKNAWISYDDQMARQIDEALVVDSNAYILAYERSDDNSSYISMRNSVAI